MRLVRLLIALAAFACAEALAFAQGERSLGIITANTRTVTAVMQREGCNPGWLSKVLDYNGIDPGQMHNLPIDKDILFDSDCKSTPPASVVARSKEIVASLVPPKPMKPKPPPTMAAETAQPAPPQTAAPPALQVPPPQSSEVAEADAEALKRMNDVNDDLRKRYKEAEEKIAEARKGFFPLRVLLIVSLTNALVGLGIGIVLTAWWRNNHRKNGSSSGNRMRYSHDPSFDK
jgi:hypothetical protein